MAESNAGCGCLILIIEFWFGFFSVVCCMGIV